MLQMQRSPHGRWLKSSNCSRVSEQASLRFTFPGLGNTGFRAGAMRETLAARCWRYRSVSPWKAEGRRDDQTWLM